MGFKINLIPWARFYSCVCGWMRIASDIFRHLKIEFQTLIVCFCGPGIRLFEPILILILESISYHGLRENLIFLPPVGFQNGLQFHLKWEENYFHSHQRQNKEHTNQILVIKIKLKINGMLFFPSIVCMISYLFVYVFFKCHFINNFFPFVFLPITLIQRDCVHAHCEWSPRKCFLVSIILFCSTLLFLCPSMLCSCSCAGDEQCI